MNEVFDRLSKVKGGTCVTIILNTHRTTPDNQKDPINLKNLISETTKRLENEYDAKTAKTYTEKLNELAESIDLYQNDHGLMLFVNEDIAEYLRIPTHPEQRIIIDDTFATRSIVRAIKKDTDYYVLSLASGKAKILLASSEDVKEEIRDEGFPIKDEQLYNVSIDEFFNRVDKAVNKVRVKNPHQVVILSDENNFHQYMKLADNPNIVMGHITLKNYDEKPANLVKEIWPAIRELTVVRNRERISELEKAVSAGTCITDINEIWTATQEGRGRTIFVEEGYYQSAKNVNGQLIPIANDEIVSKEDIDDVVDEMIEFTLKFGGDVVFLDRGSLKDFEKLALVTRY